MKVVTPTVLSDSRDRLTADTVMNRPRLAYVDNLRWVMIILVISMHAADTYSPLGN